MRSEARELLELISKKCRTECDEYFRGMKDGRTEVASALGHISRLINEALATQPEPGAVPELPEFVREFGDGWRVPIARGRWFGLPTDCAPDDLDRIAEACTKLAARERARRAS